jgi:hypothetical protein
MTDKVVGRTKHGEISIDQLAEIQPGMARLMDELSCRFWYLYYSAKGGNWKLTAHELNEAKALLRIASTVRPKYTQDVEEYEKKFLNPILDSVSKQDWKGFEKAFNNAVEGSDQYHDKYGFDYIRFVLPSHPPEHLDMRPVDKLRKAKTS